MASLSVAMVKAGFGSFNFYLICESMAAQFPTHLRVTRWADSWRKRVLVFKVKGQIGSEYLHWQCLSLSLRRSNWNVFGCYYRLKIPNCVLKQQPDNLTLSLLVLLVFFGFFLVFFDSFNWLLFRKRHVLHFTEEQKRSSFPNQWTKLHDDNTTNDARK